jgi:hypothetical protein
MPQVVDKSTCKVSTENQFSETAQNRHFNRHNGARLPIAIEKAFGGVGVPFFCPSVRPFVRP